jgi:hypothetical protein
MEAGALEVMNVGDGGRWGSLDILAGGRRGSTRTGERRLADEEIPVETEIDGAGREKAKRAEKEYGHAKGRRGTRSSRAGGQGARSPITVRSRRGRGYRGSLRGPSGIASSIGRVKPLPESTRFDVSRIPSQQLRQVPNRFVAPAGTEQGLGVVDQHIALALLFGDGAPSPVDPLAGRTIAPIEKEYASPDVDSLLQASVVEELFSLDKKRLYFLFGRWGRGGRNGGRPSLTEPSLTATLFPVHDFAARSDSS